MEHKERGQSLVVMNIHYFRIMKLQKSFEIHFLCNKCNMVITKYTSLLCLYQLIIILISFQWNACHYYIYNMKRIMQIHDKLISKALNGRLSHLLSHFIETKSKIYSKQFVISNKMYFIKYESSFYLLRKYSLVI